MRECKAHTQLQRLLSFLIPSMQGMLVSLKGPARYGQSPSKCPSAEIAVDWLFQTNVPNQQNSCAGACVTAGVEAYTGSPESAPRGHGHTGQGSGSARRAGSGTLPKPKQLLAASFAFQCNFWVEGFEASLRKHLLAAVIVADCSAMMPFGCRIDSTHCNAPFPVGGM